MPPAVSRAAPARYVAAASRSRDAAARANTRFAFYAIVDALAAYAAAAATRHADTRRADAAVLMRDATLLLNSDFCADGSAPRRCRHTRRAAGDG